ncbi:MAG: HAMP domain-containing sensor histidine kinase [Candidatus Limnocylindria bacterium]
MRGRFARRAALFIGAVILLLLIVTAAIAWLLTMIFGGGWISGLLFVVLAGVLLLTARRIVRGARVAVAPMGELIEASGRVEAGEFGAQVSERGPRELRSLARAFNAMSTRLADTETERRRLIADVSHELRTPLTVIRGNVEGMLDGLYPADRTSLERILAETHQLERLVDDLRTLSLADAGALALNREPTDLAALLADTVAAWQPQVTHAGIDLHTAAEVDGDLPSVDVDPLRIRQVLTNLIANAVRHTPAGGRVTVSVRTDADGQLLAVADTGGGMDADAVPHAFDRFWRSPDSTGAGLGLAIVRDLVEAHGGAVDLKSLPGEGTTVRCRLPR